MGKYLVCSLATDRYAMEISLVREIIRFESITPVRNSIDFLKGVINLRGKIIPVFDLRMKFGLPEKIYDEMTVIVIIEISGHDGYYQAGIAVDAVHEVTNLKEADIQTSPQVGLRLKSQYLIGVANISGNLTMLIELDKIISSDEIVGAVEEE